MVNTALRKNSKRDWGWNGQQIKWILVLLMLLDHSRHIAGLIPASGLKVFNILSRGVAPAFAYFAIEGILHTKSLKRYNFRLLASASIMELGNRLLNGYFLNHITNPDMALKKELLITDNVLWTLALNVLGISLIIWNRESDKKKRYFYFLSVLCWAAAFCCEWGVVLTPFMISVYFFRDNPKWRYLSYVATEIIAIMFQSEVLYFLVFPFIWLYNGKRGSVKKTAQYFFYVFYPVHLWGIYLVNFFLNF